MKAAMIGFALLTVWATDALAVRAANDASATANRSPSGTVQSVAPDPNWVYLKGTLGDIQPAAGTMEINGTIFTLKKGTSVLVNGKPATIYELRPGFTFQADLNLKTKEAANVQVKK